MNIWQAILKRRRRFIKTSGIIAVVLLGLGIAAYIFLLNLASAIEGLGDFMGGGCNMGEPGGIEQTESLGQFIFPPSAQNESASCGGMQGWGLDASFEMSPADLMAFQASTRVDSDQWTTTLPPAGSIRPYGLPSNEMFTQIEGMQSFLYGVYSANKFSQQILIDTSNPSSYRVTIHVLGG